MNYTKLSKRIYRSAFDRLVSFIIGVMTFLIIIYILALAGMGRF